MNPNAPRPPDPAAMLGHALADAEVAQPWPAPTIAELAAAFPELTLHDRVGQGGMAAVYHATQQRLGRAVALKVMRPDLAKQPQFTERFVREAKALATLSHPHVLAIHDFGERAGFCYLVTEYVDGANLRELMQLGRLSPDEVLRIVPQICAGVHFAHQHGVVHRDIKPENVLVDRHGQVKLADFGLAKLAGAPGPALTRSSVVMGTPHYMAPEQWHGSAGVDHRADIYSLGVVLYELLTGRLPVGTYAPASAQPGVPAGVDPIVQRSLQQEPDLRYQSVRDVQKDLERQRGTTPPPIPEAARATAGPHASAVKLLVAGALAPVIGLPVLTIFQYHEHELGMHRFSQRIQNQNHEQIAEQITRVIANGKPWPGSAPQAVQPLPQYELTDKLDLLVCFVGGAILVTVVMLLGAAAWRRTRHAGASRIQQMLAGVLFSLPVVGSASVGLCGIVDKLRTEWLFGVLGVFLIVANGAFLRWLWRLTARRLPGAAGPLGRGTRATLWLAVVATLGLAAIVVFGPRQPAPPIIARLPIAAQKLVGLTRLQLLERLGPPHAITATKERMTWSYRSLDGNVRADAVQLVLGTVVSIENPNLILVPAPQPESGGSIGQTRDELVAARGNVRRSQGDQHGGEIEFVDGTIAKLSPDGIVLQLGK